MTRLTHIAALFSTIVLMAAGAATAADETPAKEPSTSPGVVKKVEQGVVKGAKATGRGIEHAAEATARGVKRGANAVARGVKRGAKAVGHAAERVAEKTGISQPPTQDAGKQEATAP